MSLRSFFLRKFSQSIESPVATGRKNPLVWQIPAMKSRVQFGVFSSAFKNGESIPFKHSAFGENKSLPLSWEIGPGSTKSYAIFMENSGAAINALPTTHWLAWNIPPDQLYLPAGLPTQTELLQPRRMRQGTNANGTVGYWGPNEVEGDSPPQYNIQIFALDSVLDLAGGASRQDLLAATLGRVIAVGILVGKFARPVLE